MRLFTTFISGAVTAMALAVGTAPAAADTITLRMASGHPNTGTPGWYVTEMNKFVAPELQKRVAERTEHEVEIVEGYGGSIVKVAETLGGVQQGIVDIGGFCFCFEPTHLFLHNFQMYLPFGPQDPTMSMETARGTYERVPWLEERFEDRHRQKLLGLAAIQS